MPPGHDRLRIAAGTHARGQSVVRYGPHWGHCCPSPFRASIEDHDGVTILRVVTLRKSDQRSVIRMGETSVRAGPRRAALGPPPRSAARDLPRRRPGVRAGGPARRAAGPGRSAATPAASASPAPAGVRPGVRPPARARPRPAGHRRRARRARDGDVTSPPSGPRPRSRPRPSGTAAGHGPAAGTADPVGARDARRTSPDVLPRSAGRPLLCGELDQGVGEALPVLADRQDAAGDATAGPPTARRRVGARPRARSCSGPGVAGPATQVPEPPQHVPSSRRARPRPAPGARPPLGRAATASARAGATAAAVTRSTVQPAGSPSSPARRRGPAARTATRTPPAPARAGGALHRRGEAAPPSSHGRASRRRPGRLGAQQLRGRGPASASASRTRPAPAGRRASAGGARSAAVDRARSGTPMRPLARQRSGVPSPGRSPAAAPGRRTAPGGEDHAHAERHEVARPAVAVVGVDVPAVAHPRHGVGGPGGTAAPSTAARPAPARCRRRERAVAQRAAASRTPVGAQPGEHRRGERAVRRLRQHSRAAVLPLGVVGPRPRSASARSAPRRRARRPPSRAAARPGGRAPAPAPARPVPPDRGSPRPATARSPRRRRPPPPAAGRARAAGGLRACELLDDRRAPGDRGRRRAGSAIRDSRATATAKSSSCCDPQRGEPLPGVWISRSWCVRNRSAAAATPAPRAVGRARSTTPHLGRGRRGVRPAPGGAPADDGAQQLRQATASRRPCRRRPPRGPRARPGPPAAGRGDRIGQRRRVTPRASGGRAAARAASSCTHESATAATVGPSQRSSPASAAPRVRWQSRNASTGRLQRAVHVGVVGQPGADLVGRRRPRRAQRPARARTSRAGISMLMPAQCAVRGRTPRGASSTGCAARPGPPPDRVSTASTGAVHRSWTTGRPLRCPACTNDREDGERGSTLPFVLVCWLVAALMAFGAIAASDAFLEQQEVQSVCDGAALAAANRADEAVVYADGVGTELPLTRAARAGRRRRPARRRRRRRWTRGRRRPTARR